MNAIALQKKIIDRISKTNNIHLLEEVDFLLNESLELTDFQLKLLEKK